MPQPPRRLQPLRRIGRAVYASRKRKWPRAGPLSMPSHWPGYVSVVISDGGGCVPSESTDLAARHIDVRETAIIELGQLCDSAIIRLPPAELASQETPEQHWSSPLCGSVSLLPRLSPLRYASLLHRQIADHALQHCEVCMELGRLSLLAIAGSRAVAGRTARMTWKMEKRTSQATPRQTPQETPDRSRDVARSAIAAAGPQHLKRRSVPSAGSHKGTPVSCSGHEKAGSVPISRCGPYRHRNPTRSRTPPNRKVPSGGPE